ncbi:hypothetical protein C440_09412 [Haloferax mucosum ATCC BAA-1512]|uniref:Origin-associated protein OapC n=1 Tax=Haloferax mucosum ATCC BAA-1512 TaxID=662479 RepID=M0IET3_9EURY|nr:hypothetical protein C440_09412 [Haloferax mucosum ATCC BAA-1512]
MFPDGSKEMLSGCPSCGGNKFQFKPASSTGGPAGDSDNAPQTGGAGTRDLTSSAADAVRERAEQSQSRPGGDDDTMTVSDWANARTTSESADSGQSKQPNRSAGKSTGSSNTAKPSSNTTEPNDSNRPPAESNDTAGSEHTRQTPDAPKQQKREWGEWPAAPDDSQSGDSNRRETQNQQPSNASDERRRDSVKRQPNRINARETDEDNSQKSARSEVVSPEELAAADANRRESVETPVDPETAQQPVETAPTERQSGTAPNDAPTDTDGTVIEPSSDDRPNLDQLREELNDQFESIKIVNPGQYELNLMELYDRDEYIISLREDGRYVIEVPDSWGPGERED